MRVLVMIGATIGLFVLLAGIVLPWNTAAAAAVACACAIIPYVGWRASQIDDAERDERKFRAQLLERLDALEKSSKS